MNNIRLVSSKLYARKYYYVGCPLAGLEYNPFGDELIAYSPHGNVFRVKHHRIHISTKPGLFNKLASANWRIY